MIESNEILLLSLIIPMYYIIDCRLKMVTYSILKGSSTTLLYIIYFIIHHFICYKP